MGRGLLTLGVLLGSTLLLLEGALRLLGLGWPLFCRCDEQRGVVPQPVAEGLHRREGSQYIRVNREAMQVRREDSFAGRLERDLPRLPALAGRPVEVLNFGVSGFNAAQELLTLREQAWAFAPDLVSLVFFHGNDVRDASPLLAEPPARPLFVDGPEGPVLDRSFVASEDFRRFRSARGEVVRGLVNAWRVAQLGKEAFRVAELSLARRTEPPDPVGLGALANRVHLPPTDETWRVAWRGTEHALSLVLDEVAAHHHVPLLVVTATSGVQVHPDPAVRRAFQRAWGIDDLDYPDRRVAALCRSRGVPVVQLAPAMRAVAERGGLVLHGFDNAQPGTGHWNEAGHALIAHLVQAQLGVSPRAIPAGSP